MAPPPPKLARMPSSARNKSIIKPSQSYQDLFDAIGECDPDKVVSVLHTTKDPVGLMRKKDLQGLTPLRKAMALNQAEIARLLVVEGADASQRGALDKVALHDAALVGQRLLIAPLLSSPNAAVNVQDKFGMTPLHNAVRGKHVKAVEWLLFAGADVNILNNHDDSPLSLINPESENEVDRQIYGLLSAHKVGFDNLDLSICCGYVARKQISQLGSDVSLTFVTCDLWPEEPQFVFCMKINPLLADLQIPLRSDERFYCHVYKYRLMYPLPEGQRRVKLYFTILEEFNFSELILKVCSKSRILGEVPVYITSYPYQKYTNFLGTCEIDLQNEGYFVLVKRPISVKLTSDAEGIFGYYMVPLFKFAATKVTFPPPPANWNKNRRQREWDEFQKLIASLPKKEITSQENTSNNNVLDSKKQSTATTATFAADEKTAEEIEDENKDALELLEWSEPDNCDDFYYISPGWACHLSYRRTVSASVMTHKFPAEVEEPIVRCFTGFFRLSHPSNTMKGQCLCQIPKTPEFEKVGTVLVFQRQELGPDEKEDPNPDDTAEEFFMSEDGRHTNGQAWLLKEMKRWSLIPSGIISKPTRIMFNVDKLCTYVGLQLKIGEEKWDAEDETDSDESDEDEEFEEGMGGEDGEDGTKKKKKKKAQKEGDEEGEGNNAEDQNENKNITNNSKFDGGSKLSSTGRKTTIVGVEDEPDDEDTIYRGLEPLDEEFALGLDELANESELEQETSSEILGAPMKRRTLSIYVGNKKDDGFVEEFTLGPPRKEEEFEEEHMTTMLKEVALMWRLRNHRHAQVLAFTRNRSGPLFDLVLELIQESDLTVRAESRWTEGFKMVACSPPFPTLTGRLFTFNFEGPMTFEPPESSRHRPLYYYSIYVNELYYVVKRLVVDEPALPGKKAKKKEDPTAESNDVDATLEISAYPEGTRTGGMEILTMAIPLTGLNLWRQQHLTLREPDKELLNPVVTQLTEENDFTVNWWKIWILLCFDEKQVDAEKVKQDWPAISEMMLWNWFQDNIDCTDRGITSLINALDFLHLDLPVFRLLGELKKYKRKITSELNHPRQLDLLFHWVLTTKMTAASFRRKSKEPPVLSPLSDQFLLYLNELLNPDIFFDMGPQLDLEENIMNSINGEDNIADPKYKTFKALIKSKQKKDEIVGFTVMLSQMVIALNQTEAVDFVVRETRRWMASVIDTQPDKCKKLENVLHSIAKD